MSYTMGSPDPRSFSRGKRGVAGTLIFTQFDRDALIDEMKKAFEHDKKEFTYQTFGANALSNKEVGEILKSLKYDATAMGGALPIDYWDNVMSELGYSNKSIVQKAEIEYADQIPPFHVTITFANEYGQKAKLEIHHVEILNEGAGYSIDDVVSAKSYTFIARKVVYLRPQQ